MQECGRTSVRHCPLRVLALFFLFGTVLFFISIFFTRPGVLDVNQRANLDRLQTHLRRGRQGGSAPHSSGEGSLRYSIWQLGADTRQDSRQYDELCDYFINKERVGLLESPSQAIYMVPPNPKYIKPLDLPDANFMYAYVIAK
ncbi:SPOC domain protein [Toxoplasma gondii ARI]|uniref:SPOC domain protein n=1 Tax=Toxoplasma gondii ARI TaxID=1074872 RepID=A0A139Y0P3_TOXGO|nr:SPOC domain protein [Toxoplasma gondii ARI]